MVKFKEKAKIGRPKQIYKVRSIERLRGLRGFKVVGVKKRGKQIILKKL